MDTSHLIQADDAPEQIPDSALNVPINMAMNDLLRACATEWTSLPTPVWEAYCDREHMKFDVFMWRFYLVGLMLAIRANLQHTPRRVLVAYRKVRAAQLLSEAVSS